MCGEQHIEETHDHNIRALYLGGAKLGRGVPVNGYLCLLKQSRRFTCASLDSLAMRRRLAFVIFTTFHLETSGGGVFDGMCSI